MIEFRQGHVLEQLRLISSESINCIVTSPPYWGLRSYNTPAQIWGGDPECKHQWHQHRCYIAGGGGAGSSSEAFSEAGEANAERIKKARWREYNTCGSCGAWRGHLGLEPTYMLYIEHLVEIFRECKRVLRKDGVLFLNLGDSYNQGPKGNSGDIAINGKQATNKGSHSTRRGENLGPNRLAHQPGLKPKDLCGIPWRVAFALQDDGWWLRSDIIYSKLNPMPEAVTDRPTRAHEYIFLLTKSKRYYFDAEAVSEPISPKTLTVSTTPRKGNGTESTGEKLNAWMEKNGGRYHPERRNIRSVWSIAAQPLHEGHYAAFPEALAERCILAGCPPNGVVLDPFAGSFTTCRVAFRLGRHSIGIELNPEYIEIGKRRCNGITPILPLEQAL